MLINFDGFFRSNLLFRVFCWRNNCRLWRSYGWAIKENYQFDSILKLFALNKMFKLSAWKILANERFLGENCLKVDQIGFTFQTVSSRNRPKLSKFQILTCINEANKPRSTWTICHYLKTKFTTQIFTKRFLYLQRKVKLSKN